jgi:two-component system CheB/CheR fusion protein
MNEPNSPDYSPAKYIVGIGASAGGLEAIEAFFKKMPSESGLAFVVVQHLSPDYKSLMVELLSKHTEMPVNRIEDGVLVKENNIYLLPPRKNLSSFHGRLLLKEQDHSEGLNLPIDIFFRSLAEDMGEYAISIILSGTGSDGTRGIRAIKERGGMVMVQDEESAKFDGMPKNAIATGLVDFILSPDEMPKQLLSFVKHPYASVPESAVLPSEDSDLTRIFLMLREKSKVDFTYYKPTTVLRRIERRVTINQLQDLTEYVRFMENNPTEIATLFQELLIGVTCFFRDEQAFDELRDQWLGSIIEHLQGDEIRLWVTACSTGEEAYSFAMLLAEYRDHTNGYFRIKIFATDVDHKAVEKASNGIYPSSIAADVPPELLSKYFIRRDDNYQVSQKIREMVVFAQHNLIKDPPFTNINLLSCRNVLIYLQPVLQRKILELFNFSLVKEGILMLGTSESIGEMVDYFDLVGSKWKIYRSRGKHHTNASLSVAEPTHFMKGPFHNNPPVVSNTRSNLAYYSDDRVLDRFVRSLADDLLPFTLIVNEQMEVTHVFGDAKDYMAYPSGKVVQDVTKIVKKDLSIPIATGIKRALNSHDDITLTNIRIREAQDVRSINLRIKCLPSKKGQDPLLAIFISEAVKKDVLSESESLTFDVNQEAEQRISDLENELQFTRENLQAAVEELETSNEELQATNEELLASNEELQSTNEELQSVNEELYTVNAEYQGKIAELTLLNNDLDNLFNSTHIATLFLDENLDIRRFTPKLQAIFNIIGHDVGRPYRHLSHRLVDINLAEMIETVMFSHKSVIKDAQTDTGNWYLLRINPYSIADNIYAGVILTFVDIDQLKKAQLELQQHERDETQRLATIVRHSHDAISLQMLDGTILTWNHGAEELYGWSEQEALQMNFIQFIAETDIAKDEQLRLKLKNGYPISGFEAKRRAKNGSIFTVWVTVSILYAENYQRELIAFTEHDMRLERLIANQNCISCIQHLTSTVLNTNDVVILLDTQGNIVDWNHGAEQLYGWQRQEVLDTSIIDLLPTQEQPLALNRISALTKGDMTIHNQKTQRLTKDGREITVEVSASALANRSGDVLLIVTTDRFQPN